MSDKHVFDKYLIPGRLPMMLCSGCGNGIVYNALLHAIDRTDLNQDEIVISAGVGCSGRGNGYMDFCGIHSTHGRPIAYATGIKLHNPKLKLIVFTGDGDCVSIGGNHFIHAARRNIDMTVIILNNLNYGMTGGQNSPTTPEGLRTKTTPYGSIEPPFDICKLAETAGATYVARSSTYHVNFLVSCLTKALNHKGFAVVEAQCDCPTLFGRMNGQGGPADMMKLQRERFVTIEQASKMTPEQLSTKTVMGEFVNRTGREEYTELYCRLAGAAEEG